MTDCPVWLLPSGVSTRTPPLAKEHLEPTVFDKWWWIFNLNQAEPIIWKAFVAGGKFSAYSPNLFTPDKRGWPRRRWSAPRTHKANRGLMAVKQVTCVSGPLKRWDPGHHPCPKCWLIIDLKINWDLLRPMCSSLTSYYSSSRHHVHTTIQSDLVFGSKQ